MPIICAFGIVGKQRGNAKGNLHRRCTIYTLAGRPALCALEDMAAENIQMCSVAPILSLSLSLPWQEKSIFVVAIMSARVSICQFQ